MCKPVICVACACLFVISFNVSAELIDHGTFTKDDVSGLDWLDLSVTAGQSYNTTLTSNPGWRHATNAEVEDLFGLIFDGYYDTNIDGYSSSTEYPYIDQLSDIETFESLFGITFTSGPVTTGVYGFYEDEDSILRIVGALRNGSNLYNEVLGTEYIGVYENYRTSGHSNAGVFMVRTSAVPVPAAVWLFGTGLIGLIGIARLKKA